VRPRRPGVTWSSRSNAARSKVARETFGGFWTRFLEDRRPYITTGSMVDLETHGRKRLQPAFGSTPIARLDETAVRRWMAEMARHDAVG